MAPASKARPFRDKTPALAGATSVTSGIANADRHDGAPAGLLACLLSLETKRSAACEGGDFCGAASSRSVLRRDDAGDEDCSDSSCRCAGG
mmetsp:Transcript_41517/g.137581  ORF Transcript_41517/g.137581 Transcript_41517/m.137581 type:complete len:91 (+) Transcript_41517:354-626(+)